MSIELSDQAKNFQLGIYRHYKGPLYEALGIVNHSETLEEMVYYKKLEDGGLWVRPLKMFLEEVEVDGRKKPRFKYLSADSSRQKILDNRLRQGYDGQEPE